MRDNGHISVYIHIPFCRARCYYCDFNTSAGLSHLIDPYLIALVQEIQSVSKRLDDERRVHTIYFGGGTPNILPADAVAALIEQVQKNFDVTAGAEISMELNPERVYAEFPESIHESGVNRVSFGMQSASLEELRMLGRRHQFDDVIRSVELSRLAGIENINLDIIFGLPGQDLESFERTLDAALSMHPPHLSLYALTVEEGTPIAGMIDRGELPDPDEDTAGDMYALAMERLEQADYRQYEISNWAIDENSYCRHNMQYWRNGDYLGFGAGAHSYYGKQRWENKESIPEYIQSMREGRENKQFISAAASIQTNLNFAEDVGETMMMGLRLTDEGISESAFQGRFGVQLADYYADEIQISVNQGLLKWIDTGNDRRLCLTKKGRMLGNQVFMRFLRDQ